MFYMVIPIISLKKTLYRYSEIINVVLLYTTYYATVLVKHHESLFSTLLNTSRYATIPVFQET